MCDRLFFAVQQEMLRRSDAPDLLALGIAQESK